MNNLSAARACLVLVGQLHRAGMQVIAASAINGQPFIKLDRPAGLRAHHAAVDRIGRRQLVSVGTDIGAVRVEWSV
jgi:hypothetical protein